MTTLHHRYTSSVIELDEHSPPIQPTIVNIPNEEIKDVYIPKPYRKRRYYTGMSIILFIIVMVIFLSYISVLLANVVQIFSNINVIIGEFEKSLNMTAINNAFSGIYQYSVNILNNMPISQLVNVMKNLTFVQK